MAGETELFFGGDQVDGGRVFLNLDFMACGAAHGDGAVHVLAFGLVVMTFQAFGGIYIFLKRDRVLSRGEAQTKQGKHRE